MKKAYVTILVVLTNMWLFAQEKSSDVSVNVTKTSSSTWYSSPWVWVLGAAVFIILLVALTSGGRSRSSSSGEKVTVTKTVRRDDV